jgi:hypothetical protein
MQCSSKTTTGQRCKKWMILDGKCNVHLLPTCTICLEDVRNNSKRLNCGHSFHVNCILRWYETSNECPVCRSAQNDDPIIHLKNAVEERMREVYADAIRTLERQVTSARRR